MDNEITPHLNGHPLNARADIPDLRDWPYKPSLLQLKEELAPPVNLRILDQGTEGACVGFGLAAVINLLNQQRKNPTLVSPRMLYEMARLHDEWEGEDYSGSSCRGGIKGWHHTGVCSQAQWPYRLIRPGYLTIERAKAARENTVGAYYRLHHRLPDFHAALNEAQVIYASADVHTGWQNEKVKNGVIPFKTSPLGGHAFAIVGYDLRGFWVQNSWGESWGKRGLALWTYEDWQQNIRDAWVLRLALPTPQVWHQPTDPAPGAETVALGRRGPNRFEIAGHFAHIDDGHFHHHGKYWSSLRDVKETASLLQENAKGYRHLVFYVHGGLNATPASARRILAMKEVFKANKIYPFHFMYDTGILEEIKDVIFRRRPATTERVGGFTEASDWLLERLARLPGRALWREMKQGAKSPFHRGRAGTQILEAFGKAIAAQPADTRCKIHLVGHSTGGILLAHLLERLKQQKTIKRIASVSLLAPATTIDLYEKVYDPLLRASRSRFGIDQMKIINLTDRLERDDAVGPYRKSLLYFVSRSFEEDAKAPILGMQRHTEELSLPPRLKIIYSNGSGSSETASHSETHGGFDNDVATMNTVLRTVLGRQPRRAFTKADLNY